MVELVEMFVDGLPDRVTALEKALADQDLETIRTLAHQLKGAGSGYGFPSITEAAEALESTAKTEQDLDQLDKQVRELADICTRVTCRPQVRP